MEERLSTMFVAFINNPEGYVDLQFSDDATEGSTKGEAVANLALNLPVSLPYSIHSVTVLNSETFEVEVFDV